MKDDDLKQLWKDQSMTTATLSLEQVKVKAKRLHRRIAFRNAREYVGCGIVTCAFSLYLYRFPGLLMRTGCMLTILATLFIAWQMKRRASNQVLPSASGEQSWLDFQRAQLIRQRDALHSAWLWYVAPFLPGVIVFRWGVETELSQNAPFVRGWLANLLIALVFLGVAALNRYAARKLQQHIDTLERETVL
jgi:hypothetical protein